MKKAMDDMGVPSLGCVAHTLQLVVHDGLLSQRSITDTLANARKIIGHFKHSPLAYSRLEDIQIDLKIAVKRLQQDVQVRWNSSLYMLQSILEQKRALSVYAADHNLPATLTANQWTLMEKTAEVLAPFEELTRDVSKETATAADVIPAITALRHVLSQEQTTDQGVRTMKSTLLEAVETRFAEVEKEPLYSIATLVDPRYKDRMNSAVTKGYEEDVGNRTSVYVHTAHSITSSLIISRKYGYKGAPHDEGIKYVMIPEARRDYNWLVGLLRGEMITNGSYKNNKPRTYYSGQYNESRFYVLHQDFLRYIKNRFLKSRSLNSSHWAIVRPTNGAFTVFLALQTCDTVSAYGFMTEDYKKYNNYYYQKDKTRVVFYANHDYILEMKTWKKLHDSKILRLYQGPDSEKGTEKPK